MNRRDHEIWNEDMAKRYDPNTFITRSGAPIRWIENRRLRKSKEALNCLPTSRVLDVGCGPGNLLEMLDADKLIGVDISPTLLEQAKNRLSNKSNVELLQANAENLPFPDNSFDRIVCSEVLEHCLHPEEVVAEIHRVAKPGARVVITVPNENLINFTKRIILFFRLKKAISGDYQMSDNMLDEWHINEMDDFRVSKLSRDLFVRQKSLFTPLPILAYHHIYVFDAKKQSK